MAYPLGDSKQVIGFTVAIIVLTLTLTCTAEIEADGTQAEFPHGSLHDGNDLIVHSAAMFSMRVTNHHGCRAFVRRFGNVGNAFQLACWTAQKEFLPCGWEFVSLSGVRRLRHGLVHR